MKRSNKPKSGQKTKRVAVQRRVSELCKAKTAVDDRLGHYSDHEGSTNVGVLGEENEGPTHYLFRTLSLADYEHHVAAANKLHREAIRIQNALRREKRKLANTD